MKKTILILLIVGLLTTIQPVYSQSPSTIASPSGTIKVDKQIQDLKDKLATKVAEMRTKEQKAISGNLKKINDTTIIIKSNDDLDYEIEIDKDLTKIYNISGVTKKEIKKEDLKINDYLIATGPLFDKTIKANTVYRDEQYIVKSGKITEINNTDYYIKILSSDKDNYTLDIETYTKMSMLNIKTYEMEKVGVSKMKEGDTVHFVFKKTGNEKEAFRYSGQKILIIPQEYFIK